MINSIECVEKSLRGKLKDKILVGRADGVGNYENRSFYIDWKLTKNLSFTVSRQLRYYNLMQSVDDLYVYYPLFDMLKKCVNTKKSMNNLEVLVLSLIDGIENERFAKNYKYCNWCYYKEVC